MVWHGFPTPVLIFLPLVALFWLLISTLLSRLSGWFTLASRYPDRPERAVSRISGESGSMGGVIPVSLRGILTVSACPSGLRVSISRVFGPFSRPFLVPWDEIRAEPRQALFWRSSRLSFGQPEVGRLSIREAVWQRMLQARAGPLPGDGADMRADNRIIARGMLTGWAIVAVLFAVITLVATAAMSQQDADLPPLASAALPGPIFGVVFLVGYLVRRRWR